MQLSNIENLEGLLAIFHNLAKCIGSHLEVSNFAREACENNNLFEIKIASEFSQVFSPGFYSVVLRSFFPPWIILVK